MSSTDTDESRSSSRTPPDLTSLGLGFLFLGLTGFGGVMPIAHRMIVAERRWLDEKEFTDLLGVCQFLPGGNICNMAVAIGWRFRGGVGAAVSLVALLAAPTVVVIALGGLYGTFRAVPMVQNAFAGIAAAAAGLFVATAIKLARPVFRRRAASLVAAAALAAVGIFNLPILAALVVLVPIGVLVVSAEKR